MSDKRFNIIDVKNSNRKSIVEYIRANKTATKKEIAESLQLSFATVSNICNELCEHNVIHERNAGGRIPAVGRVPKTLMLNTKSLLFAAADFHNAGVVTIALFNLQQKKVHSFSFQYPQDIELQALLEKFHTAFRHHIPENLMGNIAYMGVAVSGIYDLKSETIVASELPFLEGQPLKKMLVELLGIPVYIENESNLCAMAWAEHEQSPDLIYLYVGEGLGVGIITEGSMIRGNSGYGAEICHMPLGQLRKPCRLCGCSGCLQTDISLGGFAEKFSGTDYDGEVQTGFAQFYTAFLNGEEKAYEVARENGILIAKTVSMLVNLFDPEAVVIGGLPWPLYEKILPIVEEETRRRRVVFGAEEIRFYCDEHSQDTVIDGAAEMAFQHWQP